MCQQHVEIEGSSGKLKKNPKQVEQKKVETRGRKENHTIKSG